MSNNQKIIRSVICLLVVFSPYLIMAQQAKLVLPFAHEGRITSMAFSPGGRYLLSGDSQGILKTWDMSSGTQINSQSLYSWDINAIHFISEEEFFTHSRDNILTKWALGNKESTAEFGSVDDPAILIGFSKEQNLALIFYQNKYQGFDINEFKLKSIKGHFNKIPKHSEDSKVITSPGLKYLTYISPKEMKIMEISSGDILYQNNLEESEKVNGGKFSEDNRYFAFNPNYQLTSVLVLDLTKKEIIQTFDFRSTIPNILHIESITALGFLHEDSNFLVTAGMDRKIRLWDILSGQEITNYSPKNIEEPTDGKLIYGLSRLGAGGVTDIIIAPDDRYFVAAVKNELSSWALRSFIKKNQVATPENPIIRAEIHPDKNTVSALYENGDMSQIDIASGKESNKEEFKTSKIKSFKIISDNQKLIEYENNQFEVLTSSKKTIKIHPSKEKETVYAVNQKYLITAPIYSDNNTDSFVQFWSIETGAPLFKIPTFKKGCLQIALSPNGQYLVTAGISERVDAPSGYVYKETFIQVWSVAERKMYMDLFCNYRANISKMRFSEDGNRLILLENTELVKIMDIPSATWLFQMSLSGRTPIEMMDYRDRGNISFIRLNDNPKTIKENTTVELLGRNNYNSSPVRATLPSQIAKAHPTTEQLLIGYDNGGLLTIELELMLMRVGDRTEEKRRFPYAPYHPKYYRRESNFIRTHQGEIFDAILTKNQKSAFSIGADSNLKQSALFFEEDVIPLLKQWENTLDVSQLVTINSTNKLLIGKKDGTILQWDMESINPIKKHTYHKDEILSLAINQEETILVSCDKSGNVFLNNLLTNQVRQLETDNYFIKEKFMHFLFSPDNKCIVGQEDYGNRFYVWNIEDASYLGKMLGGSPVSGFEFSKNGKEFIISYGDYEPKEGKEKINLNFFEFKSLKLLDKTRRHPSEYVHSLEKVNGDLIAWFINGNKLIARNLSIANTPEIRLLELPRASISKIKTILKNNLLLLVENQYVCALDKNNGTINELSEDEIWKLGRYGALENGFILDNGMELRIIPPSVKLINAQNEKISQVKLNSDQQSAYLLNDSTVILKDQKGLMKWYNLKNGQSIINTYFPRDDEFIAYLPNNYYYASRNLTSKLDFSNGSEAFSFEQVDLKFNRPDLIINTFNFKDTTLSNLFKTAYGLRLKSLGRTTLEASQNLEAPEITITSELKDIVVNEQAFSFSFNVQSNSGSISQIFISINDVPLHGRKGIDLSNQQTKKTEKIVNLKLSAKNNRIKIIAINEFGIASRPVTFSVFYEAPKSKPDLYIIGMGVNEFTDSDMNLDYPAKDTEDLVNLFNKSNSNYQKIIPRFLLGEDFTLNNIHKLKALLKKSKVDDHVIILYSGHGVFDENLNYYFTPTHMDFDNPKVSGIPFDELENILDNIPARNKLLLTDACHSGELDKDNTALIRLQNTVKKEVKFKAFNHKPSEKKTEVQNAFELMRNIFVDLRQGTGTNIISSSSGLEFSVESDKWKNGVFTYSLLRGLSEGLADLDGNGEIMISELQNFLAAEVSKLTENQQKPTFRKEIITNDWRVW